MARVKGFAPWNPQGKTLAMLDDVDAVLIEYREHLPLTIRQVFYRLVAKAYPKSERFYDSLQEAIGRARRSGRIAFADIRDDGVSREGGETFVYASPQEYYEDHEELSNLYERSWHDTQDVYVAVLCEASGMVPMISRALEDYRVEVASSSGFDSLTVKHDLFADALRRYKGEGQTTVLLHLGDHDPSGVWMHESMSADLLAFCEDHDDAPSDLIELRRVALTPEQIHLFGIEPQPDAVKPTNSHAKRFMEQGLEPAAQLEALPPDWLTRIVRQAVEEALDMDKFREAQRKERDEYAEVQKKLDEVNKVLRDAFGLHRGTPTS